MKEIILVEFSLDLSKYFSMVSLQLLRKYKGSVIIVSIFSCDHQIILEDISSIY